MSAKKKPPSVTTTPKSVKIIKANGHHTPDRKADDKVKKDGDDIDPMKLVVKRLGTTDSGTKLYRCSPQLSLSPASQKLLGQSGHAHATVSVLI